MQDSLNPQGAIGDLIDFVKHQHESSKNKGVPCSGIIYVHKRSDTSMLCKQIQKATGIISAEYHAGLKDAERASTQKQWTSGSIQLAVATVAFGMGIDLAHVRYVIHWVMSKTVEGFYQESGRAGRDGKPAVSVLYYSKDDASKLSFLIKKNLEKKQNSSNNGKPASKMYDHHSLEALEKMMQYCTEGCCRRQFLLSHFGENIIPKDVCCKTCDYCLNPTKVESAIQASQVMKDVMSFRSNMRVQKPFQKKWEEPPCGPPDSEYMNKDWGEKVNGLGIFQAGEEELNVGENPRKGPSKAVDILSKYEMMECQAGKQNGFVNFKSKKLVQKSSLSFKNKLFGQKEDTIAPSEQMPPLIPEHLRINLPDPLQSFSRAKSVEKKPEILPEENASAIEDLKAKIARLKRKNTARLELNSKSSEKKILTVPPSSIPFGSRKKKKKGRK